MQKRTDVDFSTHELFVTENEFVNIWYLKQPNTHWNSIKYINTNGIMAVTGDFGNWIFCREFHPSAGGGVSGGYWDEKLRISSEQDSHKYDSDETKKRIDDFVTNFEDTYGRVMSEDETNWVEELYNNVDDEFQYVYTAHRENPRTIDHEDVPFGKIRHGWLNIIYDGFDEICERIKKQNI